MTPCSSPPRQVPSEKGSALKRKNVLPMAGVGGGAHFFLLKYTLFQKGGQKQF